MTDDAGRDDDAPDDMPSGDPACWLPQVCAECGAFVEAPLPTLCWRCGAEVAA
ncbi:hypothetical protein [Cryobacterium tepidiphilum]|uniref:hypothetical protein n=1 Tax=Cryobacterium tepidiphilum TaxID=2486026 RepID=UPI0018F2EB75|nr:hypothetical protein [Cryobacterium tepidiphilum]